MEKGGRKQGGKGWKGVWQGKQKSGDINRIPRNVWESGDEGPTSGERGQQSEAEY